MLNQLDHPLHPGDWDKMIAGNFDQGGVQQAIFVQGGEDIGSDRAIFRFQVGCNLTKHVNGQGFLFGRGNQQFSPAVIRKVGRENVIVVATQTKLLSLDGGPLLVDTGDRDLDAELEGYRKVVTALGESTVYRVAAGGA